MYGVQVTTNNEIILIQLRSIASFLSNSQYPLMIFDNGSIYRYVVCQPYTLGDKIFVFENAQIVQVFRTIVI